MRSGRQPALCSASRSSNLRQKPTSRSAPRPSAVARSTRHASRSSSATSIADCISASNAFCSSVAAAPVPIAAQAGAETPSVRAGSGGTEDAPARLASSASSRSEKRTVRRTKPNEVILQHGLSHSVAFRGRSHAARRGRRANHAHSAGHTCRAHRRWTNADTLTHYGALRPDALRWAQAALYTLR